MATRAFLRLLHHFFTTSARCYEAKARIVRSAARTHNANTLHVYKNYYFFI